MNPTRSQISSCRRALVLLPFLIAVFCASAAFAEEIVIRPQALPQSTVVRLGDVAEIRGSDSGRAARLAALPLMPAPAPGTRRFLRAKEIQDMLSAHGKDLTQLNMVGSAQVAVLPYVVGAPAAGHANNDAKAGRATLMANDAAPFDPADPDGLNGMAGRRAALAFDHVTASGLSSADDSRVPSYREFLRQLIVDHLITQTGRADGWNVSCKLSPQHATLLATSTAPPTCDGGNPPWTGRQRFTISLATASGPVKLPISADVALSQPVVVAVRPIAPGAIITAADVTVQQMDDAPAANGRRAPVHAVDDLIGMEANRTIQVGAIVFTDQVQSPLLVKRGETITVVAQGGGIRVRTTALARQNGAHGDLVQLESLQTKERYDARVTGFRQASVLAPTRPYGDQASLEATADAARRDRLDRDVNAFRKYLPTEDASQDDLERQVAAFRRYLENNGRNDAQTR